jgi:hypothetical protein
MKSRKVEGFFATETIVKKSDAEKRRTFDSYFFQFYVALCSIM